MKKLLQMIVTELFKAGALKGAQALDDSINGINRAEEEAKRKERWKEQEREEKEGNEQSIKSFVEGLLESLKQKSILLY